MTVPDPPLYLAAAFSRVLREAGVEVAAGPSVRTQVPPAGTTLPEANPPGTPAVPAVPAVLVEPLREDRTNLLPYLLLGGIVVGGASLLTLLARKRGWVGPFPPHPAPFSRLPRLPRLT